MSPLDPVEICCDTCPLDPTCEEENDFRASLRPGDGEPDEYRDR